MAKVVHLHTEKPRKLGPKRVSKKRKADLEDYGQLNLFDASKIVQLPKKNDWFEEALMLDDKNDPRAVEYYLRAIGEKQHLADSYCNLGIIFSQEDHLARAVDCLTMCLKHDARHFEAHYNLGNIFTDMGNVSLAEFHFQVAIEIDRQFPNTYYNLGLLYISNKQYEQSRRAILKYIELTPDEDHSTSLELLDTLKSLEL